MISLLYHRPLSASGSCKVDVRTNRYGAIVESVHTGSGAPPDYCRSYSWLYKFPGILQRSRAVFSSVPSDGGRARDWHPLDGIHATTYRRLVAGVCPYWMQPRQAAQPPAADPAPVTHPRRAMPIRLSIFACPWSRVLLCMFRFGPSAQQRVVRGVIMHCANDPSLNGPLFPDHSQSRLRSSHTSPSGVLKHHGITQRELRCPICIFTC